MASGTQRTFRGTESHISERRLETECSLQDVDEKKGESLLARGQGKRDLKLDGEFRALGIPRLIGIGDRFENKRPRREEVVYNELARFLKPTCRATGERCHRQG